MKKRILCLLLVMLMAVSALTALTACGEDPVVEDPCVNGHTYTKGNGRCDICNKKCKHTDADGNKVCDVCSKELNEDEEEEYPEVPWINDSAVNLFFRLTNNSSSESLPSGCERYMAGEDASKSETLDENVATRNADAEFFTNVKLKYDYYADTAEYGWSKCHEIIHSEVKSGASGTPDMYCNFAYDMIAASLKGSFSNLMNSGAHDQGNFFQFMDEDYDETVDNKGYMYDYMGSVTLSLTKKYILASDYFTDAVRSFFVVPVNVALLESVGEDVTGDLNEDGEFTIDDFYIEVKDRKWDYDKVIDYSDAIYEPTGTSVAGEDLEDVLGFVLFTGFQSSGLLYSSDITVINKEWDEATGDYLYTYPEESPELYKLFDNCARLVNSKGVYVVNGDPNVTKYGSSNLIATRERFCDSKILFGGIIILGALEYSSYQRLKDADGFGVVPVPLYKPAEGNDRYLTTITNGARVGAIARSTKNFTACTAFLDYQSSHSQEILDGYYYRYLCVSVVDSTVQGTVDMLYYLRENVRSSFDKSFEDAVGVYYGVTNTCWSYILETKYFNYDIRPEYGAKADSKEYYLNLLYKVYFDLP